MDIGVFAVLCGLVLIGIKVISKIRKLLKNEKGAAQIVSFALLLPLALYVLFSLVILLQYTLARGAAQTAAAQAARVYGIYHDEPTGVTNPYPSVVEGNGGAFYSPGQYAYDYLHDSGLAGSNFVQLNPNNVTLTDDGTDVSVQLTFNFPCALPGLPELLRKNASPWQNPVPITVEAVAAREYQAP